MRTRACEKRESGKQPLLLNYNVIIPVYFPNIRFSTTLREFIARRKDGLDTNTSLALLAQLLEGLCHLSKHEIAHRDLKSDNILIDESTNGMPRLVITDFGECLAEKSIGLKMPYTTYETCKGGNAQLMAPEVRRKYP